jgi:hypothetical protein
MNGTLTKPPPAPTRPDRKPIDAAGSHQPRRAGDLPRRRRLLVEEHLRR